ncbi:DUF445 domain-containing protein [Erythrobacter donghaensis]|jgi:uncharacterized membrane-anchored protein YjiN (DUF445 family)|uniref:DUF445 domain-containing protein n=1 Tax=Erythrobacter donghaensis TaxID=267135 RepID=UPI0009C09173|nr:DUF445 domain-containing protein [Erythrobacter donghaensis]
MATRSLRPLTLGGQPLTVDRARRMRWTATGMLAAMAVIFIATHGLAATGHPAWGYVHAFAEAAMVGGLADWFAVTALFRHPLGLPIPHTAIIPENKDRIADTMAAFLRENFLTPAVVARRMSTMNIAKAAGEFLAASPERGGQDERSRITSGAAELLAEVLESLDPDRLGNQVRSGLAAQLAKLDIAPLAGRMIESAMTDKRHQPLIDGFVRWAGLTLEDNEETIREIIHQRVAGVLRWAGIDKTISASVLDGLYKLLAEVLVNPDHPLRGKIEEGLAKLGQDLQHDAATRAKVEDMKRDLIANPAVAVWWTGVWERIRQSLIARARDPESQMGAEMRNMLGELGEALQKDARLQHQINRFARRTAVGIATRYGDQIVRLVSETVKRWDATTITGRVEGAVGRDLQFIRINGTLVGGLVGMTLHFINTVL